MATRTLLNALLTFSLMSATTISAAERSDAHTEYAKQLWDMLGSQYTDWETPEQEFSLPPGLLVAGAKKAYWNKIAQADAESHGKGSVIVVEHLDGDQTVAVTICVRGDSGYNRTSNDWYWAHYLPDGTVVRTLADKEAHGKPGFITKTDDGRLWVFRLGTGELKEFLSTGDLAKRVIRPGAGPDGITLLGPDVDVLTEYTAVADGFCVMADDGRLWVFREGSPELDEFRKSGDLAKRVIQPGAGPNGITLLGPDSDVLTEYMFGAEGFVVIPEEGRLWVFRSDSEELAGFKETGDLAKHVIRPGAGPNGHTVKSPDAETLDAYLRAKTK